MVQQLRDVSSESPLDTSDALSLIAGAMRYGSCALIGRRDVAVEVDHDVNADSRRRGAHEDVVAWKR
jgi:hypothetical protein